MGDFNIPGPRERKRPGHGNFLQPTKRPGFSVPHPGSYKNSFYWKTQDIPETSTSGQSPAPVMLPPAEIRPVEEESAERKSVQYQELVDECRERSAKTIENISKWLIEVEQISSESSSKGCPTKTDFSDTSWLKEFHGENQSSLTFNLNTQLLNEITGRKAREENLQEISLPEVDLTENLSLSPILDMIDANSIQSGGPAGRTFKQSEESFWGDAPASQMRIGGFSWD